MEWDAPAIMLEARPYGEGDAVTTVMTEAHGLHRGLARGGASRGKSGTWQAGNMVQVQWTARLSDQLGSFTGELIHAGAAHAMQEALPLAMLTAICAVAEGALPEREPQPAHLRRPAAPDPAPAARRVDPDRPDPVGTGRAAPTSATAWIFRHARSPVDTDGLAFVSPRTGRAVTHAKGPGSGPRACCRCPASWPDGRRRTRPHGGTDCA